MLLFSHLALLSHKDVALRSTYSGAAVLDNPHSGGRQTGYGRWPFADPVEKNAQLLQLFGIHSRLITAHCLVYDTAQLSYISLHTRYTVSLAGWERIEHWAY